MRLKGDAPAYWQAADEFFQVVRQYEDYLMRGLRELDLYPGQPNILYCLYKTPGISQQGIAEELGITRAAVGKSLRSLEREGLVTRKVNADNRRSNRIALTETGRTRLEACDAYLDRLDHALFGGFTQQELAAWRLAMAALRQELTGLSRNQAHKEEEP